MSDARAIADGPLNNDEPGLQGADLHFDRPTEGEVLHFESVEGLSFDGAEGPKIGIAGLKQQPHQSARQPVAKALLQGQSTGQSLTRNA